MVYQETDVLLDVQNVNKTYGDKKILRNINFKIRNIVRENMTQGQIISLIGKSGSGKSTLLNIMAKLVEPDTNSTILIDHKPAKIGDMGVVFQNSYIFEWRRVNYLLRSALKRNPADKYTKELLFEEIIKNFELEPHLQKFSKELSGGQRQRVAIAEQLLKGGNFLLLDEPFSGLDTLAIDQVTKMLVKSSLKNELLTIFVVSHDLVNSLAISDSALVIGNTPNEEGSTIKLSISLAQRGLAWRENIKDNKEFRDLLHNIKNTL